LYRYSKEIMGESANEGLASYLNPIIKNAYKPFGWGVDEAVEALEESARWGAVRTAVESSCDP
jgi:hypothetical protein